jgi:hypothetical protein
MKRVVSRWLGICLLLGSSIQNLPAAPAPQHSGSPKTAEVIGRLHFAGLAHLNADPNGRVFKEIWNLPSTAQLREEALDKISAAMASHFEATGNGATGNPNAVIRPLLSDLCTAEFYAETVEHPQDLLETTLAVHLDDTRRRLWETNCGQLLSGWRLRTASGSAQLTLLSTNSWVVLRCLQGASAGSAGQLPPNAILNKIRQGQRPVPVAQDYWLKLFGDLPRWVQWATQKEKTLPRVELSVVGRKDALRTQARLTFKEAVVPRIEKWDIPLETVRDPLISFTAIQGIAPWLQKQPFMQDLGLERTPNQLYCWELVQSAFQLQGAVPVPDPTDAFQRVREKWVPRFDRTLTQYNLGDVRPLTNRVGLMWFGLPILFPYLEPVREGNHGFLHAGVFPVKPPTNPPPAQLFQQLTSQTNLIYYDWEITQGRLNQLRPFLQLCAVFLNYPPMSTNSNSSKWLDAIETRLGNSATEVSAASPRELNLVRTSPLGLNGLELLTLAKWIEGTNFPRPSLDIGFRPVVHSHRQKPAPPAH